MENFTPVRLEESAHFYDFWRRTPVRSLDYTLTNLWGWQKFYGLQWRFDDDLCWILQTFPERILWAPLGDWEKIDWNARLAELRGQCLTRVPDELAAMWQSACGERVQVEEDRAQWEYLYLREELASLSGNRFHKKRNHYNSYIKTYGEPDYRPISDYVVEEVLAVQDDWCQWHECESSPSLRAENDAINRVLVHWDTFRHLVGGSLFVDDKMIAFSIGEKLDDENLGVHYEKGLNGYKGVYQAINCEFARHAGEGFKWINRAQDLGEEGLRQAKMTYLPAGFLRKSKVQVI